MNIRRSNRAELITLHFASRFLVRRSRDRQRWKNSEKPWPMTSAEAKDRDRAASQGRR
jgi:hypothetical protein